MKVILFNIADYSQPYGSFLSLSVGYLKSYFDKYTKIKDIQINILYEDIINQIIRERPEVVGMSVSSEFYNTAYNLVRFIKSNLPKTKIIIGGYHSTTMPNSISPLFDYIIIGEGEQTFLELIEAIYNKTSTKEIKGLFGNEPREMIKVLDVIPYPYRIRPKRIFANIITSRGCPFGCTFCATTSFWKQTIRYHSAEYVVNDMLNLINKFDIRHITIWDDLFVGNIHRLHQINELMHKYDIFRKITLGISSRANLIVEHPSMLELFKEMNVIRVSIGFESGSNRMLLKMKGRGATIDNNRKALELLKKYPFYVQGGFIIGSPDETEEDIKQTYDFVRNANIDGGYAAVAIPYPGTKYWDYAEKKNIVSKDMDFSRLKTIANYKNLDHDFILLSDYIDRDKFIDYGLKIQKIMEWNVIKSYFNLKKLSWRIIRLMILDIWRKYENMFFSR